MLYVLDLFGTIVFAVTGALAAGRKHLDLFGVVVLALATALGGGTLRDLILDARPVFWVANPVYIYVAAGAALLTFYLVRVPHPPGKKLQTADALGLAVFTVIGTQKALNLNTPAVIAIIMGVMTAVVGGMVRDVLSGEIPLILRREIYATASLAGACFHILAASKLPGAVSASLTILITLSLRLAAIRWELSLPVIPPRSWNR